MDVHLVDGTYELFRHYFAAPDAVRGVLGSILGSWRFRLGGDAGSASGKHYWTSAVDVATGGCFFKMCLAYQAR